MDQVGRYVEVHTGPAADPPVEFPLLPDLVGGGLRPPGFLQVENGVVGGARGRSQERAQIYECPEPDCDKKYSTRQEATRHSHVHSAGLYPCPEPDCKKVFNTTYKLHMHKRRVHSKNK